MYSVYISNWPLKAQYILIIGIPDYLNKCKIFSVMKCIITHDLFVIATSMCFANYSGV